MARPSLVAASRRLTAQLPAEFDQGHYLTLSDDGRVHAMTDRSDLDAARQAGRFVGALLDSSVDLCPWTGDERVDLQGAWFTGFQEGRWARIQIDAAEWPPIEITLDALKGHTE